MNIKHAQEMKELKDKFEQVHSILLELLKGK